MSLNERPPGQTKPTSSTPRREKMNVTVASVNSKASISKNSPTTPSVKQQHLNPSSPVGLGVRSHKTVYPGERELQQKARHYSDREKEKQVKWFTARGHPIPTEEEVGDLDKKKQNDLALEAAQRRQEDRSRKQTEISHVATVPCSVHPLYMDEETKANRTKADEPKFGVVAATGIGGRQLLQSKFATACFTALLRTRAEQRLNKALQARAQQTATAGGGVNKSLNGTGATNRSVVGLADLNLTLLTLPSALPTGDSAGAAPPSAATSGSGQQSGTTNNQAAEFPEAPSSCKAELFHPKKMQKPLEFKKKDYHQMKFSEHPYNNADLPEIVASLPAGLLEAPEAKAGLDVAIGTMAHFQQPIVTLETHKAVPFCFSRRDPQANLVLGVEAQPVTDGGFLKPHDEVDHGQGLPSWNEDGDFTGSLLLRSKLPNKMKHKSNDDELSDTEDDEGTELPSLHPKSLLVDIGEWLPQFPSSSSATGANSSGGKTPTMPEQADATPAQPAAASSKKDPSAKTVVSTTATSSTKNAPANTVNAADEEQKQQQHFDALNATWLGWNIHPVHQMSVRTSNEAFLRRRQEAHEYVHNEALGTVPGPLKKIL